MYSNRVVLDRLQQFETENKWLPTYHTYDEILDFTKYIEGLIKKDSNSKGGWITHVRRISTSRQKEIERWIQNEQVLCSLDSNYWDKNYAWVCDEKGQMFKFKNRKSQEIFDSVISEFDEKQVSIEMLCLDPETKVLTADLRWIRLDDVKVGDELVACDEGEMPQERKKRISESAFNRKKGIYSPKVKGKKHLIRERKMRTAVVEEKWNTEGPSLEVIFEDGRKIICSPTHQFLYKQRSGSDPLWGQSKYFRVGDEVRSVTKPWIESSYEDGWYGGFLDGEGCMSQPSDPGTDVCISQRFNDALERARNYLIDRGYNYREEIDTRSSTPNGKLGKDPVAKLFVGQADQLFRLIGQTRPSRFIGRRWWEGKCLPGKRSSSVTTWAKIKSVKELPPQRLVDIQTSTGTFIAEGLVTHNCLKARQLGITTKVALKFIHRLMFIPNTQAIMASVQKERSELIKRIMDTAYHRCPWWLVPTIIGKNRYDNGSILSIQSGSQAMGLGQGWTPTSIHLSELADYPDPKKMIEEGLFRATHSSKNLFMVLEGTGGGNTGWLADTWRAAKEDWPLGRSRLCPIFIPWAMCPDIYPEHDWLRKFPIQEGFKPHDVTRKHVAKCESFIRNTPYLAKVAGANWKMPIEQIWFWQFNYDTACKTHTQKTWAAQMPADDFEALTGVHDSVFDAEVIAEVEDQIYVVTKSNGREIKERRIPVEAYAIMGHDVDDIFHPDPELIDHSKDKISVSWKSYRGQEYEWLMVPLKDQDETFENNTMDRLLVYDPPARGNYYSMGVDTADGLGKEDEDRTVLSVTNNRFHGESDWQVAEYCLASGSRVVTKDGVKKIEDIVAGDEVVNRLGEYGTVSNTNTTERDKSVLLYTGLCPKIPLELTPDHKVATSRGWVEADDLQVGDWLQYPVRPLIDQNLPPVLIKKYKKNFGIPIEERGFSDVTIPLSRDFGFICGLYLAEGHIQIGEKGKFRSVSWTLHERETSPWRKIMESAIPYIHITEVQCAGARARRLIISSIVFANWFNDNFGRKEKKHVPSWAWNAPREFIEGLALGMLAGDGSISKTCREVAYVSVLPSLVTGLRDLVLSLGWGVGSFSRTVRPYAQDAWKVHFYGDTADKFCIKDMIRELPKSVKRRQSEFVWGWNKEWIYVKVRKIGEGSSNTFHDITVEGSDPSFCTMQAAVHNCTNKLNSAQVVAFAACIGAWYGKMCPDGKGMKYVIEQIRGPGDTCQHQLKLMGFNHHHKPRRYDSKKVKDNSGNKEGWYSSGWSVPMLMDRFREAVNGGWYIPKSKWLIEELRTLERHETGGKSKMEHRSGQHDDRVRAAAQSYFTAHDQDILTERAQKRSAPPAKKKKPSGPGSANQMGVGDGW